MNYANAKKGIGQIYKAEILLLLATVLAVIGSIVALVGASKESTGGVVAGSVPLLIAGILAIIAFVMNLVGLSHASKDHPDFKTAWIITLVAIAASIVQSILESRGVKASFIFDLISNIAEVLIMLYVVTGIVKIADKLGKSNVSRLGNNSIKLICGVYILSAIVNLIGGIFKAKAMTTVAAVIAIIAGILAIISYVYYLRTLSQGSKMFD